MEIQYGQTENLIWLWLVAVLGLVVIAALVLQRRAILQFATPNLLSQLLPSNLFARNLASICLNLVALVAIVIGLVDIRWGKIWREVPQKGIEVIFALDISRSMLAEDAAPNRLNRAKQDIKDIVSEMSGDRVGLVVFAGDVRRHTPLTSHYDDFKQSLDEVGPHIVDRGGTNLADAIEVATTSFLEKTANHKAIVLFTDGETTVGDPIAAAQAAHEETGVRIFTVGLGDMTQGARIPIQVQRRRGYVQHKGEQVWSKLDGKTLEQIAKTTNGAYIPAGTKRVDMAGVYHRFIASMEQQDFETAKINAYVPRYPWFLGFALVLLVLDVLLSIWPRRSNRVVPSQVFGTPLSTDRPASDRPVSNRPASDRPSAGRKVA